MNEQLHECVEVTADAADLLFKVAGRRLISPVGRPLSFDQIESAVNLDGGDINGRTVVVR